MDSTLFVVDIERWDWPLHVGIRPASVSQESGLEDALLCSQSVEIEGLVVEPEVFRSQRISLNLTPLPREVIVGDRDQRDVGRLHKDPPARKDLAFYAMLFLPEDALANALFCLGSKWRSIHMWVDDDGQPNSVTDFGFSGNVNTSTDT